MKLIVIFILAVALSVDANNNEPLVLKGEGGGTFARTVYNELAFAYKYVKPDVKVKVTATSSNQAVQSITRPIPDIDYATSYAVYHLESISVNSNIQVVPFLVGVLVPAFNVPGIKSLQDDTTYKGIVMDGSVLADIYRGTITNWNDSRILADNPTLVFPNETIQVILRQDSDGSTAVFTKALSSFVDDWEYPSASSWPPELIDLPNRHAVAGNYGMYSKVFSTNNSIGYVSLADLYSQGVSPTGASQYYILIKNKRGDVVTAEYDYVKRALENVIINQDFFVQTNDLSYEQAWPLIGISYVILRTDIKLGCDKRRELFKWFYWSKTDSEAISRVSNLGFANLEGFLLDEVLKFFTNSICDGEYVLNIRDAPQHESDAFTFFLGISFALLGLSLVIAFAWFYINPSRFMKLVVLYFGLLIAGIILSFVSVIFWYRVPNDDSVCLGRIWTTGLGFSLILCAMFERTWQIHRVYNKVIRSSKLTTNFISFLEVGGGITILFLLQLLLLLLWTSIDPYSSARNLTNPIDFEAVYACSSEYSTVWFSLEFVYFGVLLFWGCWVVYSTWSIKESVNESRWMLICLYNQILLLAIAGAMFGTVSMTDDGIFFVATPVILFATMNTVIAVFCPLVLKAMYRRITGKSTNESSNTNSHRTPGKTGTSQSVEITTVSSNKA